MLYVNGACKSCPGVPGQLNADIQVGTDNLSPHSVTSMCSKVHQ